MSRETSRQEVVAAVRSECAGGRRPTMEELATATGVAVRTLYRLFGSRQALLREAGCAPEPDTRGQILDAGLKLVGERGLAELAMDDLAVEAGVSRATLYRLFPGKPALFGALVRAYSPWGAVAAAIAAMPDGRPEEVMPAVGRAIADAMEGRAGLLLRIVFELQKGGPDTAEGAQQDMARGLSDLARYLSAQMEASRLRRMHPIVALQLLAGPIVAHQLTRPLAASFAGFAVPPGEVVDQIVDAWLRAMAPDAGPEHSNEEATIMSEHQPTEVTNLDRYGCPPLPWSRAREALAGGTPSPAITSFLGTTRPDGRPHAAGIGALWLDGDLYFTSGPGARKARNLAANPACTVSARLDGIDVVLEGVASRVTDKEALERVAAEYRSGGWPVEVEGDGFTAPFNAPSAGPPPWHLYRLALHKAIGVATVEPFGATRWRFEP